VNKVDLNMLYQLDHNMQYMEYCLDQMKLNIEQQQNKMMFQNQVMDLCKIQSLVLLMLKLLVYNRNFLEITDKQQLELLRKLDN